jgi:hypothetical protein
MRRLENLHLGLDIVLSDEGNFVRSLYTETRSQAAVHLKVAKWNAGQAKKAIAGSGPSQKPKGRPLSQPLRLVNTYPVGILGAYCV